MTDVPAVRNHCPVSVLLERDATDDKWGLPRWRVLGVVPEPGDAPPRPTRSLARENESSRTYLWRGLRLRLNPEACSDYALNLSSRRPLLFVICQTGGSGDLQPIAVSADQQDGVDAQEVDETVFEVAMPRSIATWLEAWIPAHWRPGQRKGRRWQKLEEDWES